MSTGPYRFVRALGRNFAVYNVFDVKGQHVYSAFSYAEALRFCAQPITFVV